MIGVFLFDKNQKLIKTISPENLTVNNQTIELNGLITADVTTKYDIAEKDIFENAQYLGQKEDDNFWLYKIKTKEKQNNLINFTCVHVFFDDLKGKIVRDIRPRNVTASYAIGQILTGTGWEVVSKNVTRVGTSNFYFVDTLTAFTNALKTWNCEFIPKITFADGKISSKKIYLYDEIKNDYGKWFEYGDKLVDVVAETDFDIYTAFIGLGKGEETETGGFGRKIRFDKVEWSKSKGNPVDKPLGQDYVEIKEATEQFGYPDGTPRIGIVEFPDTEDREILIKQTYEHALENSRPKLQLKSKAVSKEKVELGEVCAIIRPDLDIRYKTRIFKIKKDFLNPEVVEFEFGDKVVVSTADRIKKSNYENAQKENAVNSKLERLLVEIADSYLNEDGYNYELKANNEYKLPAGYYSFDKPIDQNPTKVVYMGAGKILIADTKNPKGDWNWRTAITASGIAGDEIVTNSISANKLKSDVGQSLDLSSNKAITTLVSDVEGNTSAINQTKESMEFFVKKDGVITAINLSPESARIKGRNIILDGQTQVNGDFSVSGSALFGTINASNINVTNLNADNLTRGTVERPYDYGKMKNDYYDYDLKGSSVAFNGNSSYITIKDTGGRGQVDINGTVAARGTNYDYEINAGGLRGRYGNMIGQSKLATQLKGPGMESPSITIDTSGIVNIGRLFVNGKEITG